MAFDPKKVKDNDRAQSLAVSFRDNTAGLSLTDIAKDPANAAAIQAFQDAAGIAADGKVGPITLAAYNYFLGKPFTQATATKEQIKAQATQKFKAAVADVVTPPNVTHPSQPQPAPPPVMKAGMFDGLSNISPEGKVAGAAVIGLGLWEIFKKKKHGR